ncbi:Zn-dependent exopeptidase [Trametes cingulata]|nr:Zn-dependent exopeptidase [Trametes cingulata]
MEGLLRIAEGAEVHARVWQIGPSHVDIYFEDAAQRLDLSIPEVGSIALDNPEDLHLYSKGWNLSSLSNSTYHSVYHPLYEVEDFMQELATTFPNNVELVNLGHSAENREMIAMRLSRGTDELKRPGHSSTTKKTGFVITGAQHAREWIATSTALYLAHALVTDTIEDFALSSWLDYFDFYIIPVPNPDGYVYTWDNDRLWYKNRQIVGPAERCVGIDMNRNWGYKWKAKSRLPSLTDSTNETSTLDTLDALEADPCSPWYPGHRPFEAPEVNNIANFITTLPSLKAYIDLRSYGQMLSTPFSYSCKKVPKDAEDLLEAGLGAVNAIKQVHGTPFTTGSLCRQLYKASGNVVDYMYAKAGIKFSYSVHLRDTGTYGFSLPAEWIRPVGEETAKMIHFLAGFISGRNKKV